MNNPFWNQIGEGIMYFFCCLGAAIVIWAGSGFPHFWR